MGFLAASFRKDLRRLAEPVSLLIWIGVPVFIGGLMSLVSGGGGGAPAPKAHVLLVDEDDTFLSNALSGAGGSGDLGGILRIEKVGAEEGHRRIEAGEASALLVIPDGFTDGVLREDPVRLELVTNPAQRILPGIVEETLEILSEAVFYVHRLFGEDFKEMIDGPPGGANFFADARVASISADINRRLRALESILFPPALRLETEVRRKAVEETFSFGAVMLPAMLFMALLFVAQGLAADIWREHEGGTLRRLVTTPSPLAAFLAGKLLAVGTLMALVTLAGLAVAALAFDLPARAMPLALAWCTFCGIALYALFLFVQLLAPTPRAANVVGMVILFPLMMIGGSFFPFEAMPAWMARIGSFTPNGLGVLHLKDLLAGDKAPGTILAAAAGIGVPSAMVFTASLWRIRSRFARGVA